MQKLRPDMDVEGTIHKKETTANSIAETKRLIKWIDENYNMWESLCECDTEKVIYFDQIQAIQNLQKNELYPQLVNFALNPHNSLFFITQSAIIEEILETWGKAQWDEVINKVIASLDESHQFSKKQRAEKALQLP